MTVEAPELHQPLTPRPAQQEETHVSDFEIGLGERGRAALSFDDIAIAPSRRTRAPELVSTAWQIDAYRFDNPIVAAPMDSIVSPQTAIEMGRLGGLGVLNLEGLWTRYEDPAAAYAEIAELPESPGDRPDAAAVRRAVRPDLVAGPDRPAARGRGRRSPAALSPNRVTELAPVVLRAGVDLFVIRGTTVSAEHVSDWTTRR